MPVVRLAAVGVPRACPASWKGAFWIGRLLPLPWVYRTLCGRVIDGLLPSALGISLSAGSTIAVGLPSHPGSTPDASRTSRRSVLLPDSSCGIAADLVCDMSTATEDGEHGAISIDSACSGCIVLYGVELLHQLLTGAGGRDLRVCRLCVDCAVLFTGSASTGSQNQGQQHGPDHACPIAHGFLHSAAQSS